MKSPDEEKIDESFKGVVEKMEAHSMMAQVNELEAAYDTWLDYPVGEKKERDTPFHYHVVDFLLNLANNPTGANEIENPIKKNVMDFSSDEESSVKSYRSIPAFDWSVIPDEFKDDPDDLSTWSLTSDENNESADEVPDIENDNKNTSLPLVPQIEIPEPKRETLEDIFGPMKRQLELFQEYTDCYGDRPAPWVEEDTNSGFSIICKIPNNLTHDIIQKKKTLANGGIPDRGWKIYHERTVLRHLMFYGLGFFGPGNPGILFEWDKTKEEFVSRQKIGLTWIAPGSLPIKIKPRDPRSALVHIFRQSARVSFSLPDRLVQLFSPWTPDQAISSICQSRSEYSRFHFEIPRVKQ